MDTKVRMRLTHVEAPASTHLEAEMNASDGGGMEYQEMSVSVFDHNHPEGKDGTPLMVADILIGLDGVNGELRVLVSTDSQPDGHTFAIYPLREKAKAAEGWDG